MRKLVTAFILAVSLASGAALAQSVGAGPYVGAGLGLSDYDWSTGCIGECDKTDLGYKAYVGYMFTPYFGAELGWAGFGEATIGVTGVGSAQLKSSGLHGFLTAQYPVNNWSLFGKVGVSWLDNELEANNFSDSDSSTKLAWGVGGTYMFDQTLGIRAEYENYDYDFRGESDSITLWSVSIQFKF